LAEALGTAMVDFGWAGIADFGVNGLIDF